ncbi:MAG TPA: FHA domain-containing protein [Pseudonocardiaceae bacterium]|jgi:hypothetical protein|nr:FHA domain-containing protein [Pseudonocardiaceae bacterium]
MREMWEVDVGAVPVGGQKVVRNYASLVRQVAAPVPGAVFALALAEGVTVEPGPGQRVRFGRNRPQVDVCIGEDDLRVSRQHGVVEHRDGGWQVTNTGQLPIRLPGSQWLFNGAEPLPLASGYTPLFVRGSRGREHLLELYVIGPDGECPEALHGAVTHAPKRYWLTPEEKLVLVVLGQRYLAQEEFAQPLTRKQVADQMAELQPDVQWDDRKVERVVAPVRTRLHKDGVRGVAKEELVEPIGNMLNHNLIQALMSSATLVPTDLTLLDGWD